MKLRFKLTRVVGVQERQLMLSLCKEFLQEVKTSRGQSKASIENFAAYEDVSAPLHGRSSGTSHLPFTTRIDPAFLRALSSALTMGERDKVGLFAAVVSPALVDVMEALARMLLDNPDAQDIAGRTQPSISQALHLVMQSGNKDAVGFAAMAMSQIAMRRPETAISMYVQIAICICYSVLCLSDVENLRHVSGTISTTVMSSTEICKWFLYPVVVTL